MKCFHVFKDKSRSKRRGESAPELGNRGNQDTSSATTSSRATKSTGSTSSPRGIPEMYREKSQNLRAFSLSELREATNNFNRMLKLGEGGFGSVYKGSIKPPDGQGEPIIVAIKKLNTQGLQVFHSVPRILVQFYIYFHILLVILNSNLYNQIKFFVCLVCCVCSERKKNEFFICTAYLH